MTTIIDSEKITLTEQASIATTPDTGLASVYIKTDSQLYIKDDAGVETLIGGASAFPVTETRGGTGQSTYTTGDLLYSDATDSLAKLGIGTANRVLTSSGTAPSWSYPNSTTLTAWTSVSVASTTITLSSISQNYKHLRLILKARFSTGTTNSISIALNSDTTNANYLLQNYTATATTLASASANSRVIMPATGGTTAFNIMELIIYDYTNFATQRFFRSDFHTRGSLSIGSARGSWTNTADAVTSFDLITSGNNFTTDTQYMLIGVI